MLIRSSIASIDGLFAGKQGVRIPAGSSTISLCIVGPPGSGKTTVGLKYAATYAGHPADDSAGATTKVIYISTDMSYAWAADIWDGMETHAERDDSSQVHPCNLAFFDVSSAFSGTSTRLSEYLTATVSSQRPQVAFVDLRSRDQDHWGFVNRLLALLAGSASSEFPHMIVVDALDGLST